MPRSGHWHRSCIWTSLASLLVNASAFRVLLPTLRLPRWTTVRHVALAGLPFMGWTMFQTLYGQTDPVVLSLVDGRQDGRLVCGGVPPDRHDPVPADGAGDGAAADFVAAVP